VLARGPGGAGPDAGLDPDADLRSGPSRCVSRRLRRRRYGPPLLSTARARASLQFLHVGGGCHDEVAGHSRETSSASGRHNADRRGSRSPIPPWRPRFAPCCRAPRANRHSGRLSEIHGCAPAEDPTPIVGVGLNTPPSPGSISICRRCSAISVERCPMETMVMRGRTWLSMR
jgi:hypothetical protein